jgi:hypothetical protein
MSTAAMAVEAVASRILLVRGSRVLLDSDLKLAEKKPRG